MHIIAIGEGYKDALERFEKHFNGKEYSNGKCKLRVREIKLYNLNFNECGYEEVLADLKDNFRYRDSTQDFKGQNDTTQELHAKLNKYISYIRKMFKMIKPINDDLDNTTSLNTREIEGKKGNWLNCVLHPIGRINDWRRPDGKEAV